jgi:hypothetical protein
VGLKAEFQKIKSEDQNCCFFSIFFQKIKTSCIFYQKIESPLFQKIKSKFFFLFTYWKTQVAILWSKLKKVYIFWKTWLPTFWNFTLQPFPFQRSEHKEWQINNHFAKIKLIWKPYPHLNQPYLTPNQSAVRSFIQKYFPGPAGLDVLTP